MYYGRYCKGVIGGRELAVASSKQLLKKLLLCISRKEQTVEILRQFLCANANFEPYAAFCRVDRN